MYTYTNIYVYMYTRNVLEYQPVTKKKLTQGFRMDVPKSDNSKELIMTVFGGKFITT